jgi:hypothetical protein
MTIRPLRCIYFAALPVSVIYVCSDCKENLPHSTDASSCDFLHRRASSPMPLPTKFGATKSNHPSAFVAPDLVGPILFDTKSIDAKIFLLIHMN